MLAMRNWNSPTVYSWQQIQNNSNNRHQYEHSHCCPSVVGEVRPPSNPPRLPSSPPYRAAAAWPPWLPSPRRPADSCRSFCCAPPPPCPPCSACTPSSTVSFNTPVVFKKTKKKTKAKIYNSIKMNAASAFTPHTHTPTHTQPHTRPFFFFLNDRRSICSERGGKKGEAFFVLFCLKKIVRFVFNPRAGVLGLQSSSRSTESYFDSETVPWWCLLHPFASIRCGGDCQYCMRSRGRSERRDVSIRHRQQYFTSALGLQNKGLT